MESLNEKLYEHPNFVWLDRFSVKEILERRPSNNCEPIIILNNLLRWSLYQVKKPVETSSQVLSKEIKKMFFSTEGGSKELYSSG
jgi:hypothetical protein